MTNRSAPTPRRLAAGVHGCSARGRRSDGEAVDPSGASKTPPEAGSILRGAGVQGCSARGASKKGHEGLSILRGAGVLLAVAALTAGCEGVTFLRSGGDEASRTFSLSGIAMNETTGRSVPGAQVLLTLVNPDQLPQAPNKRVILRQATSRSAAGVSGAAGEYLFKDVELPSGGDVQIVTLAPGFGPAYRIVPGHALGREVRLGVRMAMLPVKWSMVLEPSVTMRSPDGSIGIRAPSTLFPAGVRRGAFPRAGKAGPKVTAAVIVADPAVDQAALPGELKAEVKDKSGEKKTVVLEPVVAVHVDFVDADGTSIPNAVSEANPATALVQVPESVEEKQLADYDKGERHLDQFCYDETKGAWEPKGKARLIPTGKKTKDDKESTSKGKTTLCHVSQDKGGKTFTLDVSSSALESHLQHGDSLGACTDRQLMAEVTLTKSCWVMVADTSEPSCIEGRVVDEDGKPLAGKWVRAEGIKSSTEFQDVSSGDDGTFKITASSKDFVKLSAHHTANAKKEKNGTQSKKGKGREEILIDTASDAAARGASGCLAVGDIEITETVEIEGQVESPGGEAAEGEVITSEGLSVEIGDGGSFRVPAESDRVDLIIKSEEKGVEITTVVPSGAVPTEVEHEVGTITVKETVVLEGKVTEDATNVPVEGAIVVVEDNLATTDENGEYSVAAPDAETPVVLEIMSVQPDGSREIEEVSVVPAEETYVPTVNLDPVSGCVAGRVVDSGDVPVSGARVSIGQAASMTTDTEGRFEGGVPLPIRIGIGFAAPRRQRRQVLADEACPKGAASCRLDAEATYRDGDTDESVSDSRTVSIRPGPDCATLDFTLDIRKSTIRGKLTDADGAPIPDTPVATDLGATDLTDDEGLYEVDVPEETLATLISGVGDETVLMELTTAAADETKEQNLTIPLTDTPPDVSLVDLSSDVVKPGETTTVTLSVSEDGSTVEFQVLDSDGGMVPVENGTSSVQEGEAKVTLTWQAPALEGVYEIPVQVSDAAGQSDLAEITVEVIKDNTPPTIAAVESTTAAPVAGETVLLKAPVTDAEDDTVTVIWTLQDEDGNDLTSLLTINGDQAEFSCPSGLEDKGLFVEVTVTDADGESRIEILTLEVSDGDGRPPLDDLVPDTLLTSAPPNPTASPDASFDFSSGTPGAVFECKLDSGPALACSSPQAYLKLPDGPHTFSVSAIDTTGRLDKTPAISDWVIDGTPPSFAGCDTATVKGPGEVELTWPAASDTVTPAAEIIYEMCRTTTSGGCCGNAFEAHHTAAPGAGRHTISDLTGAMEFYFVCRAKDRAGNSDGNGVEKAANFGGASAPARACGQGRPVPGAFRRD